MPSFTASGSPESTGVSMPGRSFKRSTRLLLAVSGVLLAIWLLSPLLTSIYVECFAVRLQTIAISGLRGDVGQDDRLYPAFTEYMYTTRVGMVHALEWMMRLRGSLAPSNFLILVAVSFVCVVVCTVVIVRGWSRESTAAILFALLLLPGFSDSGFYWADNLPSAALLILGMALVTRRMPAWRWAVVGALFAVAMLTRLDAVYALVFYVGLFLLTEKKRVARELLLGALCFAVAAGCVIAISQVTTGLHLQMSLAVGHRFRSYHVDQVKDVRSKGMIMRQLLIALLGPIAPFLLIAGIWKSWKENNSAWRWGLIVIPVAYYLFVLPQAIETRDFLLIGTPFLALYVARGLRAWSDMFLDPNGPKRLVAWGLAAAAVLVSVAPPSLFLEDGPRSILGRIWMPPVWREWQHEQERGFDLTQQIIASVKPGQRVYVISATWRPDSIVHYALLEDGWTMSPPDPNRGVCGEIEEVYRNGDRTFVQYRTENAYELATRTPPHLDWDLVQAYQLKLAISCIRQENYNAGYLASFEIWHMFSNLHVLQASGQPGGVPLPSHLPIRPRKIAMLQAFRLYQIKPGDLQSIEADCDQVYAEAAAMGQYPPSSYAELHQAFKANVWRPDL